MDSSRGPHAFPGRALLRHTDQPGSPGAQESESGQLADRRDGHGWIRLPGALERKDPQAGYRLGWQFLFPAARLSEDPVSGRLGRHHLHPSAIQRRIKAATTRPGIRKAVTSHTLQRSFATEMLRAGYDVRTVQRLTGHKDVRTIMIYIEAVSDAGIGMRSPLDRRDDGR